MDEQLLEAMARAHYESEHPPGETPIGGFSRWATWDEACRAEGTRARQIGAMRAAVALLSQEGPLSRGCVAQDPTGKRVRFYYG